MFHGQSYCSELGYCGLLGAQTCVGMHSLPIWPFLTLISIFLIFFITTFSTIEMIYTKASICFLSFSWFQWGIETAFLLQQVSKAVQRTLLHTGILQLQDSKTTIIGLAKGPLSLIFQYTRKDIYKYFRQERKK